MSNYLSIKISPDFEKRYPDSSAKATECAMNLILTADLLEKRITNLLLPFNLSPATGLVLSMLADTEQRLRQLGIDGLETFLRQTNQTREEYRERLRPEATKIARRNLVISELVKAEKIEVSEDEIGERIKSMVGGDDDSSEEQAQAAAALANLLRQGAGRNMIVSQLLTEKTIDRLLSIVRGEEAATETGEEPAPSVDEAPAE
jgi:trigger factor